MPEQKKAIVPRLRFPEFRDAGPWENIQVSDFGAIVTGKTPSTSNPKYWNGQFAWVTPTDISDAKYIYTTDRLLTSEGVQLIGILPENTVLITCIASIGKNAILKVPGSCNQQINAIIPNSNFNSDFIYYLFCKNQTILQNQAGTSATAIIPKSAFEKLYFHVPKLPEQQKIADCLSSLDELIELQAKKLEALRAYKKGLMQQLFPREGETTPRLRFPEFRDAGPWEVKQINQISQNVITGGTPSTTVKEYWGGSIRWMNSGDLNLKRVYEVKGRITEIGLRNSSTKIIPPHCVLVGLAGQGKTRGTVAMNMVDLCINQSIAAIFPNDHVFYSDYLYHNLDSRYDELRDLSAGDGGRGGINLQMLKSFLVPLPSLPEQRKIADCLSSLDEVIELEAKKLEALKAHKKGLMQQLFPQEIDL